MTTNGFTSKGFYEDEISKIQKAIKTWHTLSVLSLLAILLYKDVT